MQKEEIKRFLGKRVKLVKDNEFVIYGIIEEIYEDSLLFNSKNGTSVIGLKFIKEIMEGN